MRTVAGLVLVMLLSMIVKTAAAHHSLAALFDTARTVIVTGEVTAGLKSLGFPDPTGLVMNRNGNDVEMTWFGSAPSGPTWNTYRDGAPDPSGWGAPLATAIVDQDLGTPGIQFTDVNGILAAGAVNHYLVTEVTCAESPL